MQNSYSQKLLDHYRNPRNAGQLAHPTHTAEELNPLCGDEIKVYLSVKDGIIKDIKYEARGCALSIAAASMLSEEIRNSKSEIRNFGLSDMEKLLEVKISKAREQCATLALETIKKAMKN